MAKGAWIGVLKDDQDLSKCKLKEGLQIMLMGTAEVVEQPQEKVVFVEDMTSDQLAEKGVTFPAGMVNLGNTCYMNSCVECFRHMPEFRDICKILPNRNLGFLLNSEFGKCTILT